MEKKSRMKILSVHTYPSIHKENVEKENRMLDKKEKPTYIYCPLFLLSYLYSGDTFRTTFTENTTLLRIEKESLEVVLDRVRQDFFERDIDFEVPENNQDFLDKIFQRRDTSKYYEEDVY